MNGTIPKISIIVPVYNVKDYIEQCLKSAINQTLREIEIIAVDDGSIDGSGNVCDFYAEIDHRIKVIHKENEGLSAARNEGLDIARADYIMFLDGDDWVEPEFCEDPFNVVEETGSDIVVFQRVWHKGNEVKTQHPFPSEGVVSKKDILTDLWSLVGTVSWNKLYRRELFNDTRFPAGRLSEDVAVTHRLIHKANKVYLINKALYHHRSMRPGSIMAARSRKQVSDEAVLNMNRISDLREWEYIEKDEEIKQALFYLAKMGRDAEISDYCKEIIDGSDIGNGASWKLRSMNRLYQISPKLFDLVALLTGTRYRTRW